jgi:excisionase family DNA binding protein
LDIRGLCKYFKISEKTAYNLARERDFPSFKVNGKYRVIESDLAKWMDRKSKHRK